MKWQLEIDNVKKEIADWNIIDATLTKKILAPDELIFTSSTAINLNASIALYRDNVRCFSGKIYKAPVEVSGKKDFFVYTIMGPWYELEEIVYQQSWANFTGASLSKVLKSRVILGQNDSGLQISCDKQIEEILKYAISCTADISIGNINLQSPMLYDETKDITCAEAIKRVLKWVPDAVSRFDYSQNSTPILHISRRSTLENFNIDIKKIPIKNYRTTLRKDLQISGVDIKYEKTHSLQGESWNTIQSDKYPLDFNSACKKALVMTVELDGWRGSVESREIATKPIDIHKEQWWKDHMPALQEKVFNFKILETKRDTMLPNELVRGSVPKWVDSSARTDTIRAKVSYNTAGETVRSHSLSLNVTATFAGTGTYSRTVTNQDEEPVPQGLAKSLYDSLSTPIYEGQITLVNLQNFEFIAKKINLLNAKSGLENMSSCVVSTQENLFDNILTMNFGAPKHLYPAKIAELFRINRPRKTTVSYKSRNTGVSPSSAKIEMTDDHPNNSNTSGEKLRTSITLMPDENVSCGIFLDSTGLRNNEQVRLKKVLVCDSGRPAYAYTFLSDPTVS